MIAALYPDEAKPWIFHVSHDSFAAIEASNAAPVFIEGKRSCKKGKPALVRQETLEISQGSR